MFASTSRNFIEYAINRDRDFLAAFSPDRDRAAFEQAWQLRREEARAEINLFEPHYEGSSIVWGPPDAVCAAVGRHAFPARAGHHLAPALLSSGRNVYEELGPDFTLLAFDVDHDTVHAFADAAARLHLPLKTVQDNRLGGREQYDARLILVRPDQFVAWASLEAPTDPTAVLRRIMGA